MIRTIASLALLAAAIAAPAQADHDGRTGAWGSLLPAVHHGPKDRTPMVAPPVVIAPLFGTIAPRRLPNRCLQAVETPTGWQRFYDATCLIQHGQAHDLPRACRVRLTTWGAVRQGQDAQCLFDAGFLRE